VARACDRATLIGYVGPVATAFAYWALIGTGIRLATKDP
jgi:hypothetical protein